MKRISSVIVIACILGATLCAQSLRRTQHTVPSGRYRLEAELVMPAAGADEKGAVVFSVGSRDANFRHYTPGFTETLLEGVFLPRDTAVLYFNKRGVGRSTGNWKWSSMESRADDVLAAVDYLRTLPDIDPDRIGLVGHSQGGWVVRLAGSRDQRIQYAISLAGPIVNVEEHDLKRVELGLRCEGLTEEDIAKEVEKRKRSLRRKITFGRIFPFFEFRLMRNILQYNPGPAIRALSQPTLLAFGGSDPMAPVDQNRLRFDDIFSNAVPDHITWYVEPGTDHMFRLASSYCFDYSGNASPPYSESFVEFLGTWVDEATVE